MHGLVFEVKSIQPFIFASGRLRDVIGGSELIDLLTNEQSDSNLIDAVLQTSGTKHLIEFSRRAGGAFYAFSQDAAAIDRFAALWILAVQHWAPGLGFVLGRGVGANMPDAFAQAQADSRSQSSRERTQHPIPVPVAERARRTGRVAVARDHKDGAIDAAIQRKKAFADPCRAGFINRYSPEEAQLNWRNWPRNLEQDAEDGDSFPFARGTRDLALIHADGNGLGQVLIKIGEAVRRSNGDFLKIYQTFSKAVEASTREGAKQATREVLLRVRQSGELLAARPILLGGDDVIVLVRADLALAYVQAFAGAFEKESQAQLKELAKLGVAEMPDRLTLGFGIAFIGANQPFSMAVELAESIMVHAKLQAKSRSQDLRTTPSSLAFYRVTSAFIDDYDDTVRREMTHHEVVEEDGRPYTRRYIHTLGAYAVSGEQSCGLPQLADLEKLVTQMQGDEMARGPLRGLLNLLQLDPPQARASWRRWRQLMRDKQSGALSTFDANLRALIPGCMSLAEELPYAKDEASGDYFSPLGDALNLLAIKHTPLTEIQKLEATA